MKSKNKGGIAIIILCSILILLSLVVLVISPVAGAVAVLGGIAGIIYGIKSRKRYKAEIQAAEEKRAADEAARRAAAERKAEKIREFAEALDAIPRVEVARSEELAWRRKDQFFPKLMNVTARTNIDSLFPLVVVDVETTGLKPQKDDIIEVSAIKYNKPFEPDSCFTTLCKPRSFIPVEASRINHITDDMVEDSPAFSEIAASLSEYMRGCNILGHCLDFDTGFLYACGVELPDAKYYDTCELARLILKGMDNYKLPTLCAHYDIVRNDAHRSLSDAYATALVFERLVRDRRAGS